MIAVVQWLIGSCSVQTLSQLKYVRELNPNDLVQAVDGSLNDLECWMDVSVPCSPFMSPPVCYR